MGAQTVSFLGLAFEPKPADAAVSHIASLADAGGPFGYVVTPNVDHMVRLAERPDLLGLYHDAALILNDSRILETLAAQDGLALPASPGADIVALLFKQIVRADEPVTVIGSSAADVAAVADRLGLTGIHHHLPPMGLASNPEAIAEAAAFIAAHPARFHFLCVGSPQQEMLAHAVLQRGDATGVGICCGASLDFLSGRTRRAPLWMRNARLEWLHRIGSEPRRLAKRYVVDGPRIFGIWRDWRRGRE